MVDLVKQDMTHLWASTGDIVAPDNTKIDSGWAVETVPRQWWNWMQNRVDTNVAYALQKGIPEWDASTEYITNKSYVQYLNVIYKCILTNTNQTPSTAPTYWVKALVESTAAMEALKSVTPAADRLPYFTNGTTATVTPITAFARTVLDDVDAASVRTTISAQLSDATLTALAGVATATNTLIYFTGVDVAAAATLTAFGRTLIDDADATAARTTLGLGTISTQNSNAVTITGGTISGITDLAVADGGTGSSTASGARTNLGLGTSATIDITTSSSDSTAGRVVKIGDFGFGTQTPVTTSGTDLNTLVNSGNYNITSPVNGPTAITQNLIVFGNNQGSGRAFQLANPVTSNDLYMRDQVAGVWNPWNRILHSGNVTAYAQTLLDDATAADARTTLGLGTAATSTVTTSTTDNTAGRLLKVADFGLGSAAAPVVGDLNTVVANGIYGIFNSTANTPVANMFGNMIQTGYASSEQTQTVFWNHGALNTPRIFVRNRYSITPGVWGAWQELFHTGNVSAYAQTLLDDVDDAAARVTLGANNATNLTTGTLPNGRLAGNYTGIGNLSQTGATVINTMTGGTKNWLVINNGANFSIREDDTSTTRLAILEGGAITGNFTGLNATNLTTGIVPDARLSGTYTGVSVTGNAGTATTLQTARTINGVSFNGSANITVADATKLPLTGGNMTGNINFEADDFAGTWARGLRYNDAGVQQGEIGGYGPAGGFTNLHMALGTAPWVSGTGIRVASSGTTIEGSATVTNGNVLISSAAPQLNFTETDTGTNWFTLVDANAYRIRTGTLGSSDIVSITTAGVLAAPVFSGSATLTGVPTAPTAAVSTDSTQIATTAFVQDVFATVGAFTQSLAVDGYVKMPNGVIIQWGDLATGTTSQTFPIAFPTACRSVTTGQGGASSGGINRVGITSIGTTSFSFTAIEAAQSPARWMAIGH